MAFIMGRFICQYTKDYAENEDRIWKKSRKWIFFSVEQVIWDTKLIFT